MTAPGRRTPGRRTPGHAGRLLLACVGALVLANSCNLPKPPIPTGLPRLGGGGPGGVVSVHGAVPAAQGSVPASTARLARWE